MPIGPLAKYLSVFDNLGLRRDKLQGPILDIGTRTVWPLVLLRDAIFDPIDDVAHALRIPFELHPRPVPDLSEQDCMTQRPVHMVLGAIGGMRRPPRVCGLRSRSQGGIGGITRLWNWPR